MSEGSKGSGTGGREGLLIGLAAQEWANEDLTNTSGADVRERVGVDGLQYARGSVAWGLRVCLASRQGPTWGARYSRAEAKARIWSQPAAGTALMAARPEGMESIETSPRAPGSL